MIKTKELNERRHNLIHFNPKIDLENISINMQLRDSVYNSITEIMNKTSKMMLDTLKKDGKKMDFLTLLEKDNNWVCQKCD